MKLLSLRVEHFRCIEKARIDFASGLNLLHGPNDLGKSSLALAIRAVLLMQSTAKEHEEFVSWHGTGEPLVELVFESEPQRIWRLRKTFGSASAYLEWSKDGVDFATEARGRDVDGKLSEILKWGVAPPGGKGRPKGMPTSFLTTVLLPDQDGVGAIFDQALDRDSDESGKRQLITALQAMAEDPLFKTVLGRVQERVDEAFNSSGGKKRGKNSPWVKWSEEIQRKQDFSEQCLQELHKTTGIESEIQALLAQQLTAREAVNRAQDLIHRLEADLEKQKRRQEIVERLEERKACLAAIAKEMAALSEAEQLHAEEGRRAEALKKARAKAKAAWDESAAEAQRAKEESSRLESQDRARERQLQQSGLETRRASLQTEKLRQQTSVAAIRKVEAADGKIRKLDAEWRALVKTAKEAQKKREAAHKEREELEQQGRELRGIRSVFRRRTAQWNMEQAEKGLAQVGAWKKEAADKAAAAADLEAAQPAFVLPSSEQLEKFRGLDRDMRVAAAKLEVGVSVRLLPERRMRISVRADGGTAAVQELKAAAFEVNARSRLLLEIEDVAEIAISAGAADARQEAERLDGIWTAEVEPALQAAGATTIEELVRAISDAGRYASQIQMARQDAARLEQRAADQIDWAGSLAEGQRELAAADAELEGADRAKLEKAAAKLGVKGAADIDARSASLDEALGRIAKVEQVQDSELSAANTRTVEKQKVLSEASVELETLRTTIEGDWQPALKRALDRQTEVQEQLDEAEQELTRLATTEDETVSAAHEALARCQQKLAAAKTAYDSADKSLDEATLRHATSSGALQTRRENVAKLDEQGARDTLGQVEAELLSAPVPEQTVSDSILGTAGSNLNGATAGLKDIEGKIREKRGALQQVGGEVARQRAEDATHDLQSVKARAQEVELEFNAWELLRQTLREAEQEEGTHLGRALAAPIARRFAALTGDRYGRLALGPNLETNGVSVAGEDRLVRLLSVGTRDQLSTLFRLTLAEELKTAVILDDQLTQTDSVRMSWLRDLLQEVAKNIQVIVFTCRPEDYLAPSGTRRKAKLEELQPAARSVDLTQFIERSQTSSVDRMA